MIRKLLAGLATCECGKSHLCPIEHVEIGKDALTKLPSLIKSDDKILLVADENTYKACGEKVSEMITENIHDTVIFGDRVLVPNEAAISNIEAHVTDNITLIIGVGSGVINDLCKYTSYKAGLPYYIVATAPSMDGYASVGSALILDGMKVTLNAAVPKAIIADTEVLAKAPMDMIISGYGDIIGKYSCLCDWKLSALINGEYFCEYVSKLTYEQVERTRATIKGVLARDEEAIKDLMTALVAVGILMAYVGNSRPASGSEHHFSHYFEISGLSHGDGYLSHGLDVFYSSAETAKIREILMNCSPESFTPFSFDDENYSSEIKRVYGKVAGEVISLQKRVALYDKANLRLQAYKENWEKIKKILGSAPSFCETLEMLSEAGLCYDDFVNYYGNTKIADGYLYAKDLKDRYSVLWMYSDIFGI